MCENSSVVTLKYEDTRYTIYPWTSTIGQCICNIIVVLDILMKIHEKRSAGSQQ